MFDIRPGTEGGVETIVGDLRKPDSVNEACVGANRVVVFIQIDHKYCTQRSPFQVCHPGRDVVFHCATASPSASNASNEELMYAVNVRGTEHVVAACKVRSRKCS